MNGAAVSLQLRAVRFGFARRPAFLGPVTLSVGPGSCWGVVGPNGAGKSTLLRLMAGLVMPRSGEVLIAGRRMHDHSTRDRAKTLAFVPQAVVGDADLTVRETVLMGRYPHRSFGLFESSADRRVAERMLALTETAAFADRKLGTLSGGEAQRVHVAAALAQEPSVLLLDEPTASLDLKHQLGIFQLLCDAARRDALAVVVVTHDVNLAARFCSDVIMLDDGRVSAIGSPEAVLTPALLSTVFDVGMVRATDAASATQWLAPAGGSGA